MLRLSDKDTHPKENENLEKTAETRINAGFQREKGRKMSGECTLGTGMITKPKFSQMSIFLLI